MPQPNDVGAQHPYDFEPIDPESESVHANVIRLVEEGSKVLELGPATGYMTRALRDRGCTVVGIEIDPEMAAEAEPYSERIIVGDLDVLDLESELNGETFDVVVAADVLEHLKDPLRLLKRLSRFLTSDGAFVISVPNVAHGSIRLALMGGHFDYRAIGLMDRTHLRFFTRETLGELLDEADLGVAELRRQDLNIEASEVPFDSDVVPQDLRQKLDADPDARTYQFVVKAVPMDRPGLREIQRRLRELTVACADAQRENEALRGANEALRGANEQLLEISTREGKLRSSLVEAHDQLLRRDAEIERLGDANKAELEQLHHALAGREQEARLLRLRLERILATAPYRAYAALRSLPGMRRVAARRQAGFEDAARESSSS